MDERKAVIGRQPPASLVIDHRFRGPPQSGNGGYVSGLLAKHVDGVVRVTLRQPPPLDVQLSVRWTNGGLHLMSGDQLVAEAEPASIDRVSVAPVAFDVACDAARGYAWSVGHPFPTCFVCGPDRSESDGLRIFAGPVPGRSVVAAPWVPDETVAADDGHVRPEIVWAALDCPSWFGVLEFEPGVRGGLLGQLTAAIVERPRVGRECVAVGWSRGRDGRKLYAGSALLDADGTLLAYGEALWIAPKSAALP